VEGRQHVWEGFPGRAGDLTVYLFYYAASPTVGRGSLARLYGRFFETLSTYKEGDAELVRPTFGFIPGWSRLMPGPQAPSPRIVLVGDAAARHSPLTFCGFGSMLRSFQPISLAIAGAIERGIAPPPDVFPEEPVHAWTGALARLIASGKMSGASLNDLLDAAFGTLADMGQDSYAALLKDRMGAQDFMTFVRTTASKQPSVYARLLRGLGPLASARWGLRVAMQARGA
jgi:lycopene cyclase CruA